MHLRWLANRLFNLETCYIAPGLLGNMIWYHQANICQLRSGAGHPLVSHCESMCTTSLQKHWFINASRSITWWVWESNCLHVFRNEVPTHCSSFCGSQRSPIIFQFALSIHPGWCSVSRKMVSGMCLSKVEGHEEISSLWDSCKYFFDFDLRELILLNMALISAPNKPNVSKKYSV